MDKEWHYGHFLFMHLLHILLCTTPLLSSECDEILINETPEEAAVGGTGAASGMRLLCNILGVDAPGYMLTG